MKRVYLLSNQLRLRQSSFSGLVNLSEIHDFWCTTEALGLSSFKNPVIKNAIGLLTKVKITSHHPSSNVKYAKALFANLVLSMEIPITNCLPFFLSNRWVFLPDDLVTYSRQKSKQSTDNKFQILSEIKL